VQMRVGEGKRRVLRLRLAALPGGFVPGAATAAAPGFS